MKRRLALLLSASLLLNPCPAARAQDAKTSRTTSTPVQTQPVLVSGSEFIIVEVPSPKKTSDKARPKMPIVVVIFLWIVAMFLWQLYFNRKQS